MKTEEKKSRNGRENKEYTRRKTYRKRGGKDKKKH